jgi:uncharacterized protein (DUF433 family)
MELPQHIEIRPDVMFGKPCLKGTRIPVYLVLEKLGAGETAEQILAAYPQLTKDHITEALRYAEVLASNATVLVS